MIVSVRYGVAIGLIKERVSAQQGATAPFQESTAGQEKKTRQQKEKAQRGRKITSVFFSHGEFELPNSPSRAFFPFLGAFSLKNE